MKGHIWDYLEGDPEETQKSSLEMHLGCFVLDELYKSSSYDLIEALDACRDFLPANYVISRENYIFAGYILQGEW